MEQDFDKDIAQLNFGLMQSLIDKVRGNGPLGSHNKALYGDSIRHDCDACCWSLEYFYEDDLGVTDWRFTIKAIFDEIGIKGEKIFPDFSDEREQFRDGDDEVLGGAMTYSLEAMPNKLFIQSPRLASAELTAKLLGKIAKTVGLNAVFGRTNGPEGGGARGY